MAIKKLTNKELEECQRNPLMRVHVARLSFFHFLMFYMHDVFELAPAEFHKQLVESLESEDVYIAILGFRGSAKSTFVEAFALWAMLTGKNNFIIMIGNTMDDAKMNVANIRSLVEENPMLQSDFGINLEKKKQMFSDKWTESQLVIGDCTILARSRGSKVRGKKFKKARIDMIICDDVEDVEDAKTVEKRKATRSWFFTEVLQATKQGTLATDVKVIMIGNLVHRDCLLKHLQKSKICVVHEFPLLDKITGEIMWPALYPTQADIENKKEEVMMAGEGLGPIIWAREYLLVEADEEDMILQPQQIQRYPKEWLQRPAIRTGVGNDLAISKKQKADFTAFVPVKDVMGDEGTPKLLVLPNAVNLKLGFTETIKKAVEVDGIMPHGTKFYCEKIAYQESALEMFEKNGIQVDRMTPTSDKLARTTTACYHVITGRVMFPPEEMCTPEVNLLIAQLTAFGIEPHDDLSDAFSNVVIGMVSKKKGILFG